MHLRRIVVTALSAAVLLTGTAACGGDETKPTVPSADLPQGDTVAPGDPAFPSSIPSADSSASPEPTVPSADLPQGDTVAPGDPAFPSSIPSADSSASPEP